MERGRGQPRRDVEACTMQRSRIMGPRFDHAVAHTEHLIKSGDLFGTIVILVVAAITVALFYVGGRALLRERRRSAVGVRVEGARRPGHATA